MNEGEGGMRGGLGGEEKRGGEVVGEGYGVKISMKTSCIDRMCHRAY